MDDAAKRAEIGLCLMLAAADGEVSDAEVGALSTRLGKLLGDNVTARTRLTVPARPSAGPPRAHVRDRRVVPVARRGRA